ncbi:MAG: cell division ATP-binding protein FtsE [Pseudomonadota bacterium]|nr:cell division ATP-binding protein FtsE [Pseudomonadota bacterium]
MVRFTDVSKRYEGTDALKGVTLTLKKGEMAFVTGHSGAGKSTLLRLIALLDRANGGQVVVDGQNLARIPHRQIPHYRRRIGLIFQDHRLLPDRTVFDNVALPLVIAGQRGEETRRRVRAALDQVGLLSKEKSAPAGLSTGEQQRVGIARAVVHTPPLLLADEPTGNLDPDLSREIMDLFQRLNQIGTTVLIASHDINLIRELGHRALRLEHGQLVEHDATEPTHT